jgi:rubrerythrin
MKKNKADEISESKKSMIRQSYDEYCRLIDEEERRHNEVMDELNKNLRKVQSMCNHVGTKKYHDECPFCRKGI